MAPSFAAIDDILSRSLLLTALALGQSGFAEVYQVGPSRGYRSVSSLPPLSPGDRVEIEAGTYNEVKRWTRSGTAPNPILIRGVGGSRPVFDAAGKAVDGVLPNPRAAFQIEADYVMAENLEFKNARNGNNGAGICVTGGQDVTVRRCKSTTCDMEIMSHHSARLRSSDGGLNLGAYEFKAATPRIDAATCSGNHCFIEFAAAAGQCLEVQRTGDVTSGGWSSAVVNLLGTGARIRVLDPNAMDEPRAFYRLCLAVWWSPHR